MFRIAGFILIACVVLGVLMIFFALAAEMWGTRVEISRTEPGQYGCYFSKQDVEFLGIHMEDVNKVCPYTPVP